jgi:hypothetical protein
MLHAGAAIKDDVRLSLAPHLRLPKQCSRLDCPEAKRAVESRNPLATFPPQRHLGMMA